jgi:hypothetical protein
MYIRLYLNRVNVCITESIILDYVRVNARDPRDAARMRDVLSLSFPVDSFEFDLTVKLFVEYSESGSFAERVYFSMPAAS